MRDNLTHAIEDYLKEIYLLTQSGERASTTQLSERLEVTPASVTGMLKRLSTSSPPLLVYRKHHGVKLTPEGENVALEIIRHHRLLESFLHETLEYSWDEVHAEADRLEHVISEDFEERIARMLDNPLHDPHGHPIPTSDLRLPEPSTVYLGDLRSGQKAIIKSIENQDPAFLRYLKEIGLTPKASVAVLDYSPFDDNLHLQVGDHDVVVGSKVTRKIFVDVLSDA